MNHQFDIIIIGAGIVGLASAYQVIKAYPALKIAVLDKENSVAKHQTSHNSGVIHSGIYYKPGSLKAENCKRGYNLLLQFCEENSIKYNICGKIIVSTKNSEKQAFENIYNRGLEHKFSGLKKLSPQQVNELEPFVKCTEGIWVPQTGIIDYKQVAEKYLEKYLELGGLYYSNAKVLDCSFKNKNTLIVTSIGDFESNLTVNCAGLYSDKIARMQNKSWNDLMIIPFRGEYYELMKDKEYFVNNLIYPVPNPDFPFLGVHFTRMIHGGVEAGPNAVLAFKREGYKRWDINLRELYEILTFPGFKKVASKYWDEGWMEMKRSFSKKLFVRAMKEIIPEISENDVFRSGAGVRAQACDSNGNLLDDFNIIESDRFIHVCNAPSPAATSSLSIGLTICDIIKKRLK